MKNTKWYILLALLLVIGIVFTMRIFSKEDTWICQNGNWVKHGSPREAKPSTPCGNPNTNSTIKSNDGKIITDDYEINLPYGWYKMDNPMPGVSLMVINGNEKPQEENTQKINFRSYFAITYTTSEKNLEEYFPEYESTLKNAVKNAQIENVSDGNVNGYSAKFLELKTYQQNINFKAFVAIIKGEGNDIWVISFNTTDKLWSSYTSFIPELLNTFKIKK